MQSPALHENEQQRLEALRAMCVLDTPPVPELDRITRLAARLFDVPIVLISLVDNNRQWFKSRVGLDTLQTPRDISLCAHAILQPGRFLVTDAEHDPRFADNPLVAGPLHLRFYAGQPLHSLAGLPIGTLCLISPSPRTFSTQDEATLQDLAAIAQEYFQQQESSMRSRKTERELAHSHTLFEKTFAHAAVGIALVSMTGRWLRVNQQLSSILGYDVPTMQQKTFQEITHPDDLQADLAALKQLLDGEISAYSIEKRYFHANGSIVWVLLSVSLIYDEFDQSKSFVSVVTDITERKNIESELLSLQQELEQRVDLRTRELQVAVEQLHEEVELRTQVQHKLVLEKERFRLTLANATDAFIELDESGRVMAWNSAAEHIFGWTLDDALARPVAELVIPPQLREPGQNGFDQFVIGKADPAIDRHIQFKAMRKDGSEFPVELTLAENRIQGRRVVNAFLRDISQRKADEQEILTSRSRLRLITDNMPVLISFVDEQLRYQFANRTYESWFGGNTDSLIGTHMSELLDPKAYAHTKLYAAKALKGQQVSFDNKLVTRKGVLHVHTTLVPNFRADGRPQGFYILSQDITERKNLENKLAFEATHDALTGLPNRRAFMRVLHESLARSHRSGKGMALLFLDLDGFKQINDQRGHEFGDQVLRQFAQTLRNSVRETDTVARLAGDEFTVILEGLDVTELAVQTVAHKLLASLATVHTIGDEAVHLRASIGAATVAAGEPVTPEKLLAIADAAMYRAKAQGKHQVAIN